MLILQESRKNITSYSIQFGYGGNYIKQSNAHVHSGINFQVDGTWIYHIL